MEDLKILDVITIFLKIIFDKNTKTKLKK